MFMRSLDNASTAARAEQKDVSPVKLVNKTGGGGDAPNNARDSKSQEKDHKQDKEGHTSSLLTSSSPSPSLPSSLPSSNSHNNNSSSSSSPKFKDADSIKKETASIRDRRIIHAMTEYLFDLFDANCMEEFHLISAQEEAAISLFERSGDSDEYTFEMQAMHTKFSDLFESLIEKFLNAEKISIDEFYSVVHRYVERKCFHSSQKYIPRISDNDEDDISDLESHMHAKEIVDIIYYYSDFYHWAKMIREQIKYRKEFRTFYEKMEQAILSTSSQAVPNAEADSKK